MANFKDAFMGRLSRIRGSATSPNFAESLYLCVVFRPAFRSLFSALAS